MAPPAKRGLGVALLIGALAMGATLLLISRVARTNPAANMAAVVAEEKRAREVGLSAPGAAEVRALGCEAATVIDLRGTFAILGVDAGREPVLNVVCNVAAQKDQPSCELVAEKYSKAVATSDLPFTATVRMNDTILCEQAYPAPAAIVANAAHWHEVEEAEHGHLDNHRDAGR